MLTQTSPLKEGQHRPGYDPQASCEQEAKRFADFGRLTSPRGLAEAHDCAWSHTQRPDDDGTDDACAHPDPELGEPLLKYAGLCPTNHQALQRAQKNEDAGERHCLRDSTWLAYVADDYLA